MDLVQTLKMFVQHLECIGLVRPGETAHVFHEYNEFQLVEEKWDVWVGLAAKQLFDASCLAYSLIFCSYPG